MAQINPFFPPPLSDNFNPIRLCLELSPHEVRAICQRLDPLVAPSRNAQFSLYP
jgi:hypothetical protein